LLCLIKILVVYAFSSKKLNDKNIVYELNDKNQVNFKSLIFFGYTVLLPAIFSMLEVKGCDWLDAFTKSE